MGSSIRACARLAALLLLATLCAAQQISNDYIPPNKYIPPPPAPSCPGNKIITTTRLQETVKTLTRVQYRTVTVTSTIQTEQIKVQPTTVTKISAVTVTQPVYITNTQTVIQKSYVTSTQLVGGGVKNVVRTEYVPVINTVVRSSTFTKHNVVTRDSVRYVTEYSTVFKGTPPATPTVYVTSTVTIRGPVVLLTSTKFVPKYVTQTVQQPAVVKSVYNTKYVTVDRVVKSYGQDVQRTQTVRVPQVQYQTSTSYVTKTELRVVDATNTVRNTQTKYVTNTVVRPVNVVKTEYRTNTVTRTSTVYVTQPVVVTTKRVVASTQYGPDVVRTAVNTINKQVSQPGPTVYVTEVSSVVRVNTQRVTSTAVVQRYVDRVVEVKQPCDGYNYADQGNPLNI